VKKNRIEDLRDHLFETIEALRDEDSPMELDRARTIADVARVIVDTAKAEVAFVNATGATTSGFFPGPEAPRQLAPAGRKTA
jgi:hypothetical protein